MTVKMGFTLVFAAIPFFLICDGFLLDDRTKPVTTSGPLLTDQHYNNLINLIMTERQSRAKLEQHVVRLEQDLLATQQGVTDIFHTSADNNATLAREARNWNTLYAKYNDLDTDHSLLKLKFEKLDMKHSNLENYTKVLEQEVASLQQLKGVTDLQTVLNVRNETKILREELKTTNNLLNSVRNEAEARKQDFVALLNKADSTEQKLELTVKALYNNINNVSETQHQTELEIKRMQNDMQRYQNVTFRHLQENLGLELHNMSNRAAFTVCARDKSYARGSTIIFPYIQTRFGVSNSALSAFGHSGRFTCEEAGLYLISGFFMTDTEGYVYLDFYKNVKIIGRLFFSVTTGHSYQTSTIVTLQYLNKHDTLHIQPYTTINVFGNTYSCISFLQLTN